MKKFPNYKPCQKVIISFDPKHKDFSKIPKKHFGNYTPIKDSYLYGRILFQKENGNIHLFVDESSRWTTGSDKLTSAAAGDMNPASERNSYCKDCAWRGAEMTSWSYSKDGDDMIQSDKIKEKKTVEMVVLSMIQS